MRTTIAFAAGLCLALGAASHANADDRYDGTTGYDQPAYGKDPRQLMPDENPLKGAFGTPQESATARAYDATPSYGKDPRQLMPDENPLKGVFGPPQQRSVMESHAEQPEYGKDPRQLMPDENPLKGVIRPPDPEA